MSVDAGTEAPVGHARYFALAAARVGVPIRGVSLGFAGATRGAGGWHGLVVVTGDELRLFALSRNTSKPPEALAEAPGNDATPPPRRRESPSETLDPEVVRVSLGAVARVDTKHFANPMAKSIRLTFTSGERLSLRLVRGVSHGADVARLLAELVAAAPRCELSEGTVVADPRVIAPGGWHTAKAMLGGMVGDFLSRS